MPRARSVFTKEEIPQGFCVMTIMKYKDHAALITEGVSLEQLDNAWINFYDFLPASDRVSLDALAMYEKVNGKIRFLKYDPCNQEKSDIQLDEGAISLEAYRTMAFHARSILITEEVFNNLHEQIIDDQSIPPDYMKAGIQGEFSFFDRLLHRQINPTAHNCISWAREKIRSTGVLEKNEMKIVVDKDGLMQYPALHAVGTYAAVYCPVANVGGIAMQVARSIVR